MSQEAAVQVANSPGNAPELENLVHEHRDIDEKVAHLDSKPFLTTTDEAELHRLKKEKLRLKDQIEEIRHRI